jgi:predicted RNA binding protein YcfA (HicA-like mRNA interferase family)
MISSREVMKRLRAAGWTLARVNGSHHVFTHPDRAKPVVVKHPTKDYPIGTLKAMEKQSGPRVVLFPQGRRRRWNISLRLRERDDGH